MKCWKGWKESSWAGWGIIDRLVSAVRGIPGKMPLKYFTKWINR